MREEPVVFINGQACACRMCLVTRTVHARCTHDARMVHARRMHGTCLAHPRRNTAHARQSLSVGAQACAPRTDGNMNENVEYLTQIEGYELDAMERRMRDECVEAAAAGGGTIGVFYQKTGTNVVSSQWSVVSGQYSV